MEHFFGDIRLRGGWCINPTAVNFRFAFKSLLSNRLRLYGLSTDGRNCAEEPLELDDGFLPQPDNFDLDAESARCDNMLSILNQESPTEIRANIMYYMAGWAARQVCQCNNY